MTQQSGQTPVKVVKVNHFSVYCSGYTETILTGELSANNSILFGPTPLVCFEPRVWPVTCCS